MKPAFFLIILLLAPVAAYADSERQDNPVTALGWVAIASGLLGTVPYILYNRVKKISVVELGGGDQITRDLAMQYKPLLNVHMALNIIGFTAGAVHGILLIEDLDTISLSLAIVMTVLTITGIILRFSSGNLRVFTKLVHNQVILSGLLVVLIILHVTSML
ncbi:MAG: hypothetical protein DA330_01790 [Nitrososphaera sp.]|nr:hypothetical protein [Nitrososphaera sp.]